MLWCVALVAALRPLVPDAAEAGLVAVGRPPPRRRKGVQGSSSLALAEDIERRVAQAGGNVEGVIVASLSWSTPDDLDLHLVAPGGSEINFQHRRAEGGELDVDMCVHGKRGGTCTDKPVENVVFALEAPQGRYKVYVQNFNFHPNFLPEAMQVARMQEGGRRPGKEEQKLRLGRDRPVLFEVLVKVEGSFRLFRGLCTPSGKTHALSNVRVFEFDYFPEAEAEEDRFVPHFEAESDAACGEFEQKLLEAGRPPDAGRLEGGARPGPPQPRDAGKPPKKAREPKGAAGGKGAKGRGSRMREETKNTALAAIRASSRDALLSKPSKALNELLRDLGTSCKACLEKADIVDRLLGVRRDSAEL
mmetsp:Transcript_110299/g.322830  ORF Transcript_110299/g.322830 Transcript_110299/m.322830 type:complete len:361 (+) Transcript_110299:75-1157(+)